MFVNIVVRYYNNLSAVITDTTPTTDSLSDACMLNCLLSQLQGASDPTYHDLPIPHDFGRYAQNDQRAQFFGPQLLTPR